MDENIRICDKILEILADNRWHKTDQMLERIPLPREELNQLLVFLANYDFLHYDEHEEKVKINREVSAFLKETRKIEIAEAVGDEVYMLSAYVSP